MAEFRTTQQILTDFTRIDPQFSDPDFKVADSGYLIGLLTDDRLGEAALYASGNGPILFDLGVLKGPEWEGVHRFLNSTLVSPAMRLEFQQFENDLIADKDRDGVPDIDTNRDGFLNNQELVAYAQTHTDRWPNVATFRNAAEVFMNRLPGYLAQPNLDPQQIARLWGVMNHMAGEYDRMGASEENRGTVYGLLLQGFPSGDQDNPPDLIRRALSGDLTPQELAAVHHALETQMADGKYQFEGSSPLSPMDVGMLGQILNAASAKGHKLYGMTIVNGDAETELFAERNQAAQRCLDDTTSALKAQDGNAVQAAFTGCATDMAQLEGQNPDRIGATALTMRAYTGDLSPAETALLRRWMQDEANSLGISCDGTLDCLKLGAMGLVRNIMRDPWHFIARNGVFFGGSYLYRRLLLRKAFENRLSQACGGQVINPRDAYRNFERHLKNQMKNSPMWKRFLNQLARNPRRTSLFGRIGINFPVTFLHLAAFNAIAARKDTGNLAVDVLTDLPLIALFEGLDTYDAFKSASIANFAQANPGLCRPSAVPQQAPVKAPAPEQETNPVAELSPLMSFAPEPYIVPNDVGGYTLWSDGIPMSVSADAAADAPLTCEAPPEEAYQPPILEITDEALKSFAEADYQPYLEYLGPKVSSTTLTRLPEAIQFLYQESLSQPMTDWWHNYVEPLDAVTSQMPDMIASAYANEAISAEDIRSDVDQLLTLNDGILSEEKTNGFRWALQQYLQGLESGFRPDVSPLMQLAEENGIVYRYFNTQSIRQARQNSVGQARQVGFEEGVAALGESEKQIAYNRAHADELTEESEQRAREIAAAETNRRIDAFNQAHMKQAIFGAVFAAVPIGIFGEFGAAAETGATVTVTGTAAETSPGWGFGLAPAY